MATYKIKKADNKTTINVNILTEIVEESKAYAKENGMSFTAYCQFCLLVGNSYHRRFKEQARIIGRERANEILKQIGGDSNETMERS